MQGVMRRPPLGRDPFVAEEIGTADASDEQGVAGQGPSAASSEVPGVGDEDRDALRVWPGVSRMRRDKEPRGRGRLPFTRCGAAFAR